MVYIYFFVYLHLVDLYGKLVGKYIILGGSSQLGYVVNNHGDRFSPLRIRLWDHFQMAFHFMAYKLG